MINQRKEKVVRFLMFRMAVIAGFIGVALSICSGQESRATGTTLSGQITGQVRYNDRGQPAFNVLVRCDSLNSGSCGQETTDRSGRFRFTGLSPSQYIITLRVPGYIEQQQTVELLTSPSATIQFQLRRDGSGTLPISQSGVVNLRIPLAAEKEFDQSAASLTSGKKEGVEDGIRHLIKAINIYPEFVQAHLMLGTAYMDLGQLDKAEQSLKRTVELDPKTANAWFALGELYSTQKKDRDAEKTFLNGLEIESRSYQAHLSVARVYLDMASKIKVDGQAKPLLEKAYDHVNQSLKLNPNFSQAHLVKGNLLLQVGRAEEAQHQFEEFLRLEPKGVFADQARAVIEKIKKALKAKMEP
jgi:cytochrome c-type biogenesis protein CcmH/NrfG